MSEKRRKKRKQKRESGGHLNVLASYLSQFYELLESEIKPSDQEVRDTFIKHRDAWHKYCDSNKLTDSAKDLFVMNVEMMWKRRANQPSV